MLMIIEIMMMTIITSARPFTFRFSAVFSSEDSLS